MMDEHRAGVADPVTHRRAKAVGKLGQIRTRALDRRGSEISWKVVIENWRMMK